MPNVRMPDGKIVAVPDGTTQEELMERYSAGSIDNKTGAPALVRAVVGASPQQDRLANIQRFYPEAKPMGDDNFEFTDPNTQRRTAYNPPGLDLGDFPSIGKEIVQSAAGMGGAALAAPTGWGSPVLGAISSQAAGNAYDQAMSGLTGMIDTRTGKQRVAETLGGTATEAVFGRAGNALPAAIKRGIGWAGGAGRRMAQTFRDFTDIGARPSADLISESRPAHLVGRSVAGSVFGGSRMQESDDALVEAVSNEAERVARSYGDVLDVEALGGHIRRAGQRFMTRFTDAAERKYADVGLEIPDTARIFPSNTFRFSAARETDDLAQQLPETAGALRNPKVTALTDSLLADFRRRARDGQLIDTRLGFQTLTRLRSRVGKIMGDPVAYPDFDRAELNGLYAAISRDMEAMATASGPRAAMAWRKANDFYARHMNKNVDPLNRILAKRLDQEVYSAAFANTGGKKGGSGDLKLIRRTMSPDEWDAVAGTVLGRMGRANNGAQNAAGDAFSASTFLTNWSDLSDAAKQTLFNTGRYSGLRPGLDRLTRVADQMRETQKAINTSNTSRHEQVSRLMGAVGLGMAGAIGFGAGAAVDSSMAGVGAAITAYALAPRSAAALLTNQRFVGWLADSTNALAKPNGWGENIGRLVAISAVEPEIREEIQQYLAALRPAPTPKKPPKKK